MYPQEGFIFPSCFPPHNASLFFLKDPSAKEITHHLLARFAPPRSNLPRDESNTWALGRLHCLPKLEEGPCMFSAIGPRVKSRGAGNFDHRLPTCNRRYRDCQISAATSPHQFRALRISQPLLFAADAARDHCNFCHTRALSRYPSFLSEHRLRLRAPRMGAGPLHSSDSRG